MWLNIILTSIVSALCSLVSMKLSHMAYDPELPVPFAVKAFSVGWLFISLLAMIVGVLFLIWS